VKTRAAGLRPLSIFIAVLAWPCNALADSELQYGLFRSLKRAVSHGQTALVSMPYGAFGNPGRLQGWPGWRHVNQFHRLCYRLAYF